MKTQTNNDDEWKNEIFHGILFTVIKWKQIVFLSWAMAQKENLCWKF